MLFGHICLMLDQRLTKTLLSRIAEEKQRRGRLKTTSWCGKMVSQHFLDHPFLDRIFLDQQILALCHVSSWTNTFWTVISWEKHEEGNGLGLRLRLMLGLGYGLI